MSWKKNKENIKFLKPTQTSGMTADKPLFMLAKLVQGQWWTFTVRKIL
jgi:hypothetical protein